MRSETRSRSEVPIISGTSRPIASGKKIIVLAPFLVGVILAGCMNTIPLQNKESIVLMRAGVEPWHSRSDFNYDMDEDSMQVNSYLMKKESIVNHPDKVSINIYAPDDKLIKTLISETPDKDGVFHIQWNNTGLKENTTYWAKVCFEYASLLYQEDRVYNISIPVKLR